MDIWEGKRLRCEDGKIRKISELFVFVFMASCFHSGGFKLISTAVAQVSCRCRHGTTVCPSESLVLLFSANADDRRGLRYCQPFIGKLRYLRNVFSATAIAKRRFDRKSCEFSLNSSEAVGSNTIFCGHAHEGEIMVFIFNYFSFLNLKSCEKLLLLVPVYQDFSMISVEK